MALGGGRPGLWDSLLSLELGPARGPWGPAAARARPGWSWQPLGPLGCAPSGSVPRNLPSPETWSWGAGGAGPGPGQPGQACGETCGALRRVCSRVNPHPDCLALFSPGVALGQTGARNPTPLRPGLVSPGHPSFQAWGVGGGGPTVACGAGGALREALGEAEDQDQEGAHKGRHMGSGLRTPGASSRG